MFGVNPFSNLKIRNILRPDASGRVKGYDVPLHPERKVRFSSADEDEQFGNGRQRRFQLPEYEETAGIRAYKDHLANVPTEANTKPGKIGRIAAALSGASEGYFKGGGAGFSAARDAVTRPYKEAVDRWNTSAAGLQEAANMDIEEQKNRHNYIAKLEELGIKDRESVSKSSKYDSEGRLAAARADDLPEAASIRERDISVKEVDSQTKRFDSESLAEYRDRMGRAATDNSKSNAVRARAAEILAGAAVTNAGANVTRANSYRDKPPTARQSFIPVGQQKEAEQEALRELMSTPEGAKFIRRDEDSESPDRGKYYAQPPTNPSEMGQFNRLWDRIKKIQQRRLGSTRMSIPSISNPYDDISEWIPEP